MIKPYFQVDLVDGRIQCVAWYPDPEAGPVPPVVAVLPGIRLVDTPLARDFTREGRRDTELAFWLDGDEGAPGTVEWVETATLEDAIALAWSDVKAARDAAEAAPFEFEGYALDPNKINLAGAALRALMAQLAGESITRVWTLADNTEAELTGAQLIAAGAHLADRVDAIHSRGRELRKLIENATTPEEAFGYTWKMNDAE